MAFMGQRGIPEPLARFADLYRAPNALSAGGAPHGEVEPHDIDPATVRLPESLDSALDLLAISSPEHRLLALEACLALLLEDQGVAAHDVAILSLGGQTQSSIAHLDSIGHFPVAPVHHRGRARPRAHPLRCAHAHLADPRAAPLLRARDPE